MFATLPANVMPFRDDDQSFFAWLDDHPHGFFIDAERNPKRKYLVLHRPDCTHFRRRNPSKRWTRDYVKLGAETRAALEE